MTESLGTRAGVGTSGSLGGGTEHLLRMARTACQSAIAFVALGVGGELASAISAAPWDETPRAQDVIEDLVRQLWFDPGIARHKAVLRAVRVASREPGGAPVRVAVATVPFGADDDGRPLGLLGVADPHVKAFGFPDVELLSGIAGRLTSHVAARQHVRRRARSGAVGGGANVGPRAGDLSSASDLARLLREEDPATGLLALGALLAKTGRLLGALGAAADGSIAVVALEVSAIPAAARGATTRVAGGDTAGGTADDTAGDTAVVARAVRAIRAELRHDDLVSSLGGTGIVAVVPFAPGSAGAQAVDDRLAASARAAVHATGAVVRSAHVAVDFASRTARHAEAHELVRDVLTKLQEG